MERGDFLNSSWSVTEEIKSQTKVAHGIYLFDFFFVFLCGGVTFLLQYLVHEELRVAFWIFSLAMIIFLTLPSSFNKKRRNYQSILILLRKDKVVYKPTVVKKREQVNGNNNY